MGDISRTWWLLLVRGIAAIIFGILTWAWPAITLLVLVIIFGVFALVNGVFALGAGFRHGEQSRVWLIVSGIIGILAGIVALVWPGITSLALLFVVAFWAILAGISEIAAGFHLRKTIEDEWMLIVGGILLVLFGIILLLWPGAGLLSLVWLLGFFAILYGIAMAVLAFRVKKLTPGATA
ncbi:HdeD family acid-resistance protein [Nonomuraea sp. NPDC046802]|uniref:HdeD family acid-resistance protein n=1 Tax=Nonomuraea sp. NPDC046802 TaxID=3154919 RepID=UPI0033CE279D